MATRPAYKTDEWMQLETRLKDLDNGGKIDSGILDLVVVLNLLGIHTISSCEGHLHERLTPAPGSHVLNNVWSVDRPIAGQGRTDYPYVDLEMEGVWKLQTLLEKFYAPDPFFNDYELGIVLHAHGYATLKNVNAPGVSDGQESELEDYQKEFRSFTTWVKRRWQQLREELHGEE